MTTGIICALDSEYERLTALLETRQETVAEPFRYVWGTMGGNRVVMTRCGIGKVNAALGASELIRRFAPDLVLSTGVAGGIDPCLQVTDVVVSERVVYHDVWCGEGNEYGQVQGLPTFFEGYRPLLERAARMDTSAIGNRIHTGLICTGDRFVTSKEELAGIKARFPEGLAVDMESGAIAQVCYIYKVSFLSLRIISDTPGVEAHFNQYLDFWGIMADRSFQVTRGLLTTLLGE
ncbi:MAG: 5'-methylthioadenosine/adenosylhomocysteine nucleosidase [Prevotellaceae bacterium]|nr:5'-methylthioadenosine/adenosylhomocysteine nucleosidase [Prevotellaceae bacterium]